ncbi:MAG TPA: amino acid adenylation domain-containing protein [Pyrinomonadaceae bacterium]
MSQSIVENSNLEAHSISVKSSSQLAELHGEQFPHFTETSFPRLFEHQVSIRPDATAIVCENQQLTFRELNARANQLAGHLQTLGISRESIVGICIDRSVEMAVAIIATLKAGAAYLPLDPEYPTERLAFMLEDARPAVVLTKASLGENLFPTNGKKSSSPLPLGEGAPLVIRLDEEWPTIAHSSEADLDCAPAKDDLAYVIYTSGSTGNPKGVMITHGNLTNYLLALNHELKINADDLYLHTASIAFSSSRRQLLLPLSQGAGVVVATSDQRKDPLALFQMIKARAVSVMDAVPSFWRNCTTIIGGLPENERRELLDNRLRLMLSASEPLLSEIPRKWMTDFNHPAHHVHMFGQTETAGIVALFHVSRNFASETHVPVGNPIANTAIYVLNENQQTCAIEEAGELYIGGAGVGRGYLNRSQLTAEKFIERDGVRLYRTGDWARVAANGQIEFAGRRDQQVKLRGFRIELGEIEAALSQHPSVRECVVVARESSNGTGDKKLAAYFVPHNDGVSVSDLRAFLSARVPDYAVPSAFLELKSLPISANGKVDRLCLPEPEISRAGVSAEFVAAQDPIEIRLAQIWSEVLSVEVIGRDDNFFELGGHSLLAAQIAARVRRHFKFEAPISTLFEYPTIRLLAERISSGANNAIVQAIHAAGHRKDVPLSFNQQQFWLLDQSSANQASYNVRTALKITGTLNIAKLQKAIDAIVARHEILRTNVVTSDGSPMQVIASTMPVAIRVSDLSPLELSGRESERARAHEAEASHVFDLTDGPLLRARLLKFTDADHELIITMHHIVCDGWSIGVLLRELTYLYQHGIDRAALPPLPIQYSDFAVWQRGWLEGETIDRQLHYWKHQLANAPTVLDLPTDYQRPAIESFEGGRVSAELPAHLAASLKLLSRNENATLFMTLLAAFQALLFRYSGQEDVIIGSPVAGRTMFETENLIGAFVNTLVLRGDMSGQPTFSEVLARVRQTVMGAFCHQDLPFEKLVEELNPERKANRSPLFQVMFAFQNMPEPQLAVNGVKFAPINVENDAAKFDLTLEVQEAPDGISVSFEYARDLFATETIERMLAHYRNVLVAIVSDPAQRVDDLQLLGDEEQHLLLVEWNDNGVETLPQTCVHNLFEAQVARTPNAIAAEFKGERLTYAELNARANQLAHYLRAQGVGPETLVGVSVPRSLEMLVAILGVLKAGGGYVPLDPKYPRERLQFMIEDATLAMVITKSELAADLADGATLLCIDRDWEVIASHSDENTAANAAPNNVAYVIYTSGSTGNPKGVAIEHHSLASFARAATGAYRITDKDRVLQFASLSFDLSAEEIYPALTQGATVVLRTEEMISSARDFLSDCAGWEISVLDLPTAYWHELTDALNDEALDLPSCVRLVIIGGEKASADRVAAWHCKVGDSVRLVNSYGPTETTVAATVCDLKAGNSPVSGTVSIGRPLANTSVYVLDRSLQPCPIGVSGQLHIGGPCVARGYINRPELTAEKFIRNPFSDDPAERLYKTGDLVRYRPDGSLDFIGRVDNQIKIRGFRVELEEIEQALRSHEGVKDCVVILCEDHDARLIAYVVANGTSLISSELRSFLKSKLPSYMVPAIFETIEALPLMPSGKINRRALPDPKSEEVITETFVAPSTPLEELLAAAWREVLRVMHVGVSENFFDLGGHSLLAAKVVSIVSRNLTVNFGMVDLFQAPTIAALAEMLSQRVAEKERTELEKLLEEVAAMSEEEAQQLFDSELQMNEAAAA